jgi:hypothetical protein
MSMRSSLWSRTVLVAVLGASAFLMPGIEAAPGQGKAAATVKSLTDAAGKGNFDANSTYDALIKAGMSPDEANAATDQIRDAWQAWKLNETKKDEKDDPASKKLRDDAQKAADAKQRDQNASGSGDWNMGQVYRDRDYKVSLPIENACRVDQVVTITYPKAFILTGPSTVAVPAKSKVFVDMVLEMTKPPMPIPPWPPGVQFACYDLKDSITLVHPELQREMKSSSGTELYVCNKMERTYSIGMHVHQHGPPGPPDPPGGGGGGGKKKPSPVCSIYWNHNEFYPTATQPSPSKCTDDIRSQAIDYVGSLDAMRRSDPVAWAWLPKPDAIGQMSVPELMQLKAKMDAQAKGQR